MPSSSEMSMAQQELRRVLAQLGPQLGMDPGALANADAQISRIPPERVHAALKAIAARRSEEALRMRQGPRIALPAQRTYRETVAKSEAKQAEPKTSKKRTKKDSYVAEGPLPAARQVYPSVGGLNKSPVPRDPVPLPTSEAEIRKGLREFGSHDARGNPLAPSEDEIREMVKGRVIKDRFRAPREIDQKKLSMLVQMKRNAATPQEKSALNKAIAAVAGVQVETATDRAGGGPKAYKRPERLSDQARKIEPNKLEELADNESLQGIEKSTATEAREIREGDADADDRGLKKFERRPVDQKDPWRAKWQTMLREESDPKAAVEHSALFKKGATNYEIPRKRFAEKVAKIADPLIIEHNTAQMHLEEAKKKYGWGAPEREEAFQRANQAQKRLGLFATDVIEESTRMAGEEGFAASLMEKHPEMREAYIGRLEYLSGKNPKDQLTRQQLEFAREGKYGAALSSGKMAYSKKLGNEEFYKQAEHQRDMAADHDYRYTTRDTAEKTDFDEDAFRQDSKTISNRKMREEGRWAGEREGALTARKEVSALEDYVRKVHPKRAGRAALVAEMEAQRLKSKAEVGLPKLLQLAKALLKKGH